MAEDQQSGTHAAEAAALGFYYQAFFALLALLSQDTDNAAVGIEQLDDVELSSDGRTLLYQLKHSISAAPPPITLKSKALWRTMKVWIDALPLLTLFETTFHLIAVGGIPDGSSLSALLSSAADRTDLRDAMVEEAQRVVDAQATAAKNGKRMPHAERLDGCVAFLGLTTIEQLNLLRRTFIKENSPPISEIEACVADYLKILPTDQRTTVAKRLIEWWDRELVYSLCGKRDRVISRAELQQQISAIVGDIEQGKILPDFEMVSPPEDYQPDGMLARQINLVNGKPSDLLKAIREEWRAREQRARWANEKLSMASKIDGYDSILREHWSDRHSRMIEECGDLEETDKCAAGLKILRWTHDDAPNTVRPIFEGWSAPYYVRGSYQVLAINRRVGWHPNFSALFGDEE